MAVYRNQTEIYNIRKEIANMTTDEKLDKLLNYVEEIHKNQIFQNHKLTMLNTKINDVETKLTEMYDYLEEDMIERFKRLKEDGSI